MRRLLLALPFAMLPLAVAHAADEHDHAHGSLGAHEHGVGRLNAGLDGQTLELELESPAMNLVGFEHVATSDLASQHFAAQLVERLGWALADAERVESHPARTLTAV